MGLFKSAKRAVKKVTRPIAKVLDKVVPNEIKPFLPYLSAVAPVLGPQLGILSNLTKLQAAGLYGGGALASQLAQEGSEGDFDILPIALAAGSGYLAQPGEGIGALQTSGEIAAGDIQKLNTAGADLETVASATDAAVNPSFGTQIKDFGIKAVRAAEDFMQPSGLKATVKAITPTVTGQIGQDAYNFAKQAEKDYLLELDAFNALAGEQREASDENRRSHIIASMTRANFTQDVIDETLDQLGLLLKDGGIARLGFNTGGDLNFGGIKEAIKGVAQNNMEEGVTQMYVSDSAGVIPLRDGDAVTGKTMDMMVSGFVEPYTKNDFRDPDGYERFMDIFSEFKETKMKKDKELNEEGMKKGGLASLKDGGIMDLGGKEMDMRTGGFIPIGAKERADDVPARLSKNEFVMTADAVRAAGGGSVNKGAKRMYDLMHNLEARA